MFVISIPIHVYIYNTGKIMCPIADLSGVAVKNKCKHVNERPFQKSAAHSVT